jgi:hypothetical protein
VAGLEPVETRLPSRTVSTYQGVMVTTDAGVLAVNVNGNVLPARWADPLVVAKGDSVLVEINSARAGQGRAFVRCRLTDKPRPGTGTVKTVPPSSPTITVTGSDGVDYTATFVSSYTPVVNDPVILSWNASIPSVVGKITTTAAEAATVPPPVAPPPGSSGGANGVPFWASHSDTYWPSGGWGSWAGGGNRVYQGDYGSGQVYGAWFYAGSVAQLAGKTITRIRFKLGSRRPVGASSSPVTVHFYAHTSAHKPGGDVSRTQGPHDVIAQPSQGITEYDLSLAFAPVLQAGGGIAIAGNPYAGFLGVTAQPESGLLLIDWRN